MNNLRSKTTTIHGPVIKFELNFFHTLELFFVGHHKQFLNELLTVCLIKLVILI